MLTETEAKSRALDDLASFFTAQQIPTTAAELRNAHIDIEELWSKTADPFLRAAAGQANVHGEHIVEVLKAGMLKRLLRILFDFYPLAERFDYPPRRGVRVSQSPAFTSWLYSLHILGGLGGMVMNIPLPEITQTHKEWQRSGEQILKLYSDCRFFRPMPGEVPEDRQLAGLRVSCMRSLSPILSAPREGARSSARTTANARAAVPILVRLRATIPQPPKTPETRDLAYGTAIYLSHTLRTLNHQEQYSPAILSGYSNTELVDQCLNITEDVPDQLESRMEQMNVLAGIVDASDENPALMTVLSEKSVLKKSVELMHAIKKNPPPGGIHNKDIKRKDHDWYDRMINMWSAIIGGSSSKGDERPSRQAVRSNLMFLLEWWCLTAPDIDLNHILSFVLGIVGGLGLKDLKTTERWTIQLRVILGRMKRSHIRPKVTKAWVDACDEMQTSTGVIGIPAEPAIVCGLVGCETVVAATMMCGRCKETFYCSAECQKSDWKEHKTRCKQQK